MGDPHRIAERIQLPFPFRDAGFHVGLVVQRPAQVRPGGGVVHERVGIGVDQDRSRLAGDQPMEQRAQARIAPGERHIGMELCRAVAQPHRIDIAGDDERVGLAVDDAHAHRRVERVGVAIGEHPRDFRIADACRHAHDLGLDRGADEASFAGRRAATGKARRRGTGGHRSGGDHAGHHHPAVDRHFGSSIAGPVRVKPAQLPAASPGCPPPIHNR